MNSVPFKLISQLTVLAALYFWADARGYTRAVNVFQVEYAEKLDTATRSAIHKAHRKIAEEVERNQFLHAAELRRAKNERIVDTKFTEVVTYVDKIKYVNNCGVLSADSIKLLNSSIDIGNRTDKD
jgi:hypothetical protein